MANISCAIREWNKSRFSCPKEALNALCANGLIRYESYYWFVTEAGKRAGLGTAS